jgi:hypothetical protein
MRGYLEERPGVGPEVDGLLGDLTFLPYLFSLCMM